MPHLRPLLATLAISLTLPLSAATEEKTVYKDTEPYVVPAGKTKKFTDHISNPSDYDVEGSYFWFRLKDNTKLVFDMPDGCRYATVCIETAADPDHPAELHFIEGYNQFTPIIFKHADDAPNGTLVLYCATWTEKDGQGYNNYSEPIWQPDSITVDCNLTFISPLPVDDQGNAYVGKTFTIPSGCTCRLETKFSKETQLPEIALADETSTLVFAEPTTNTNLAEKYCDLLKSSAGRFVFKRNTTINSTLTFTNKPTIEIDGVTLHLKESPPQFTDCNPTFVIRNAGTLRAPQANLQTVKIEGEGTLRSIYSLDCLTGNGTAILEESSVSKNMDIYAIRVDSEEMLKINGNSYCKVQRIEGNGTVSFIGYIGGYNWKDLDAILRESKFTGTFESEVARINQNIDFTEIKENTFSYTIMPHIPSRLAVGFQIVIKMRLEQYVNLVIKWPPIGHLPHVTLKLIESGPFQGQAIVPAFSKELEEFIFESAAGSPIDCKVEYGEETNTLTWMPTTLATPGFVELPDDVNQMLAPDIPKSAVTGTVISKYSVEEVAEALRTFSGIHEIVSRTDSTTETNTVDLHVDYEFGISRLTFVDGGRNILIEVSLFSKATPSPTFLGDLTLFVNNEALKEVTELFSDEGTDKYGLIAPTGKTVRWFVVPYETLPRSGKVSITVSAKPPQAN